VRICRISGIVAKKKNKADAVADVRLNKNFSASVSEDACAPRFLFVLVVRLPQVQVNKRLLYLGAVQSGTMCKLMKLLLIRRSGFRTELHLGGSDANELQTTVKISSMISTTSFLFLRFGHVVSP